MIGIGWLLALFSLVAVHGQTALAYSLDWTLGVRFGIERVVRPRLGLRGDMGLSALGQMIALDALAFVDFIPDSQGLGLRAYVGIPNLSAAITFRGAMVSFGGALAAGWRVGTRSRMEIRIGGGFPLFFEKDEEIVRDIDFPLQIWPDAALSLIVPRRGKASRRAGHPQEAGSK